VGPLGFTQIEKSTLDEIANLERIANSKTPIKVSRRGLESPATKFKIHGFPGPFSQTKRRKPTPRKGKRDENDQ